ncbi:MAG: hypothetical protein A7315_04990 [Candidatus Altiarchaeales archaeon WOR_SM1_79]|nr:MAG: hypothetical protein A7315_04990 [Candidatus Altiarchaeales archaeon WOR_SM1_79]
MDFFTGEIKGTDVPGGHITINTTWTQINSPYIILGDVIVDLGMNLTIEPGVEVKLDGDYSIFIEGNLSVQGIASNHIVFTSNSNNPSRGDWESIRINSTGHLKMNYCDISYGEYALYLYGCSNNFIENCTVSESRRHGIYVRYSSFTFIKNSDIGPNNWNGIYLRESTNAEVANCTVHLNSFEGISTSESSFIKIMDCESSSNEVDGVHFFMSSNITLTNSSIYQNMNNGLGLKLSKDIIIQTCTIFSNDADGVFLPDNINITIKDCTINDHDNGLYCTNSSKISILNSIIHTNKDSGISLIDTSHNTLDDLDIYSCGKFGITLTKDPVYLVGCFNTTINNTNISDNMYGVLIRFSQNTSLENSYIYQNKNGLIAQENENPIIIGNNISNNQYYGISFIGSSNGFVTFNELYQNYYGIFLLAPSENNLVHHNTIKKHVYYSYGVSFLNQWDDGAEGNYWGDYDGVDMDSNGIGDTPYPINPVGEDRYPLVDFNNTRFKILSTIPSNESINVPNTTTIKFSLSEGAIISTFEGNITIFPSTPILSYTWEDFEMNLTLTIPTLLEGELYIVTINANATGISGRSLSYPFILIFYTDNSSDTIPPTITEVYPTGSDVLTNTSYIGITFSELMVKSSVESAFSIYPDIPGEFEWINNTLYFYPKWEFLDLKTYTVTINGSIAKDAVGHTLDGNENGVSEGSPTDDYKWSFTTTMYDVIPPTIKKVEPTGNMVDITSPIKIYFSELMNKTSVENAFSYSNGTIIWTSSNGTWGRSEYLMTFIPDQPFNYSQVYTVTLLASAYDWHNNTLDGNANGTADGSPDDDYIWTFKTTYNPKFGLPTINQASPQGMGIGVNAEIIINFSQEMNQNSVEEAFTITDGTMVWGKDDGIFVWTDNRTCFIPNFNFDYNTTYTVKVNITASNIVNSQLDGNGNGIPEDFANDTYLWNFTTVAIPELIIKSIQVNGNDASDPSRIWYLSPGEMVNITAIAKNIGYNTTGASFILSLYNITGPIGDKKPFDDAFNHTILPLEQGKESGNVTWDWWAPLESGNYYGNITVDFGNDISELVEENNSFTLHFAVNTDLTITNVTVDGLPIFAYLEGVVILPGQIIIIGSNITNIGQSSTGNFKFNMSFWNCTETGVNQGNILADLGPLGPLSAGTSTSSQYTFWQAPISTAAEDYFINISADSNFAISEANEDNNIFILHIRVDAPDLAPDIVELRIAGSVVDTYADPLGIGLVSSVVYIPLNEDLEIIFDAINLGGVNQSFGTNVTIYNISGLGGEPLSPPFFGTSFEFINLSAFGFPYDQTSESGQTVVVTWFNPGIMGMYYINISLDPFNKICELNESNNIFTLILNVSALPVTAIKAVGPVYYGTEWYITNSTQINLTPISGMVPIYTWYRIIDHNSGVVLQNWVNYTGNTSFVLTFSKGTFRIEYNSTDAIISEKTKYRLVIVDNFSPNSTIIIGEPKYYTDPKDILNISANTPLNFNAVDSPLGKNIDDVNNASGLYSPTKPGSGIYFRIWSVELESYITDWQKYILGVPFYLSNTSWVEGLYEVHYNATDNLGNNESMNIYSVYLDTTPPSISIDIGTPNWMAGIGIRVNVSSITQFIIIATEQVGSGVNSTFYRIYDEKNGIYITDWKNESIFSLSLALSDGNYTIQFYAQDNVLNMHTVSSVRIYLDNSAPTSYNITGEPKYRLRVTDLWTVAQNTTFYLQGDDGLGSGVKGIYYSIWNDSGILVLSSNLFSGPFSLSGLGGDGLYTVRYWALDNLNNTEKENELKVILDIGLPTIISSSPTGSGNAITSYIQITFSEEMDHDSVKKAFSYTDGVSSWDSKHGFFNWNANIMTFYPYEDLLYETSYTVIINTTAYDHVLNRLDGDGDGIFEGDDDIYCFTFETVKAPDYEPPEVVFVSPSEGAQNVTLDGNIEIEFSESMNEFSVEDAFSYSDGEKNFTKNDGVFIWEKNKAIFTPNQHFNYDTKYTVSISTLAEDISNNAMVESYIWNFTTHKDIDPPHIVESLPKGDNISVNTNITIIFNEPMNKTSVELAFIIVPFMNGTFTWVDNALIFMPEFNLKFKTTYFVYMDVEAKDIAGNSLTFPYLLIFTTETDTLPPSVVGHTPIGDEVDLNAIVTVTFNEEMQHSSVEEAFSIVPYVQGNFSWAGNTLIFIHSGLTNETTYTVTITTGAKDLAGNALLSPYQFSFTTKKDPFAPYIIDVEPKGVDVPLDSAIRITFNEAMNRESVYSAFTIEPYVFGTFSWDDNTLIFTPSKELQDNTRYNVTILYMVSDLAGNSIAENYSWHFETKEAEKRKNLNMK